MRILGIDPGYAICGYGVIDEQGSRLRCIDYGTFSTPAGTPFEQRLLSLHSGTKRLILAYKPDAFAIEELFLREIRRPLLYSTGKRSLTPRLRR